MGKKNEGGRKRDDDKMAAQGPLAKGSSDVASVHLWGLEIGQREWVQEERERERARDKARGKAKAKAGDVSSGCMYASVYLCGVTFPTPKRVSTHEHTCEENVI